MGGDACCYNRRYSEPEAVLGTSKWEIPVKGAGSTVRGECGAAARIPRSTTVVWSRSIEPERISAITVSFRLIHGHSLSIAKLLSATLSGNCLWKFACFTFLPNDMRLGRDNCNLPVQLGGDTIVLRSSSRFFTAWSVVFQLHTKR